MKLFLDQSFLITSLRVTKLQFNQQHRWWFRVEHGGSTLPTQQPMYNGLNNNISNIRQRKKKKVLIRAGTFSRMLARASSKRALNV